MIPTPIPAIVGQFVPVTGIGKGVVCVVLPPAGGAVAVGAGVGEPVAEVQPQEESDAQSGFRQKPE